MLVAHCSASQWKLAWYTVLHTHIHTHTHTEPLTGADLKANREGLGAERSGEITAGLLE